MQTSAKDTLKSCTYRCEADYSRTVWPWWYWSQRLNSAVWGPRVSIHFKNLSSISGLPLQNNNNILHPDITAHVSGYGSVSPGSGIFPPDLRVMSCTSTTQPTLALEALLLFLICLLSRSCWASDTLEPNVCPRMYHRCLIILKSNLWKWRKMAFPIFPAPGFLFLSANPVFRESPVHWLLLSALYYEFKPGLTYTEEAIKRKKPFIPPAVLLACYIYCLC